MDWTELTAFRAKLLLCLLMDFCPVPLERQWGFMERTKTTQSEQPGLQSQLWYILVTEPLIISTFQGYYSKGWLYELYNMRQMNRHLINGTIIMILLISLTFLNQSQISKWLR